MKLVAVFACLLFGYASAQDLLWSDEFNGAAGQQPDPSTWGYDLGGGGWGNQEHQYYTNDARNVAMDGQGNLVITARRENPNNYQCWHGRCEYTSARIKTEGKRTFQYGRIESRIQIPGTQGIWPAFWMLGHNIGSVGWPECGEIDIMENVGFEPHIVHGTLHGPGYSGGNPLTSSFNHPNGRHFKDDYHIYRVDWTRDYISWSVDGVTYATKTPADTRGNRWAFDNPHFLIFNCAVGGQWPGYTDGTTVLPQTMKIDYVRVYSNSGATPPPPASNRFVNSAAHYCLDIAGGGNANGTPIQVAHCSENQAQQWTINGQTIRALGKCLDVQNGLVASGTPVQLHDCNGSGAQQWKFNAASNDIVNLAANRCLEAVAPAQDGARTIIADCSGQPNQKWNRG